MNHKMHNYNYKLFREGNDITHGSDKGDGQGVEGELNIQEY